MTKPMSTDDLWSARRPCGEVREAAGGQWMCCTAPHGHATSDLPHVWLTTGAAYAMGPERRPQGTGFAWARWVVLRDGRVLAVGIRRGRSVRMAYAKRGQKGYKWCGYVNQLAPEHVEWYRKLKLDTQVPKGTGVKGLLQYGRVIPGPWLEAE